MVAVQPRDGGSDRVGDGHELDTEIRVKCNSPRETRSPAIARKPLVWLTINAVQNGDR
jgi:hypothetical protein